MLLLKSWADSVKPSNLKLLFLVTLNMLRRHYKFFASVLVLATSFIICGYVFTSNREFFLMLLEMSLLFLMPFIFVLVARPSIKRKNLEYFWDYKWHFLAFLIVLLINTLFIIFITPLNTGIMLRFFGIFQMVAIFLIAVPIFVLPIKIIEFFSILFWLDSRVSPKNLLLSVWRATKMFVFNLPAYLIFIVIPYFCFMLFISSRIYLWPIFTFLILLASIFYISFLVNLYTKNIHDKFKVYFGE